MLNAEMASPGAGSAPASGSALPFEGAGSRPRTLTLAVRRWSWAAAGLRPDQGIGDLVRRPREHSPRWLLVPYTVPVPPVPAAPLPVVPLAFRSGVALVPSCLAVQGVLAAMQAAGSAENDWTLSEQGRPSYTFRKRGGTITTSVSPLPDAPGRREVLPRLWETAQQLSDLDGDVLLAALAQAILPGRASTDGTVWLTADAVLEYRGIRPKTHREGPLRYRAGHRDDDRAQIAASIARLDQLWVRMDDVAVLEPRAGRRPRRTRSTHEGKLLTIAERLTHDGDPVAWRYAPGSWLAPFLTSPNRQIALLPRQALRYDPYHKRWEKRLARYLTFHLRMDAKNARPLVRRVGPLLDALHLPIDRRHPERTRTRFEAALRRLADDGVIGGWAYTEAAGDVLARRPSRRWLEQWLEAAVAITAAPDVTRRYAAIAGMAQRRTARTTGTGPA